MRALLLPLFVVGLCAVGCQPTKTGTTTRGTGDHAWRDTVRGSEHQYTAPSGEVRAGKATPGADVREGKGGAGGEAREGKATTASVHIDPPAEVTVNKGGSAKTTVHITRTNFAQDVQLEFKPSAGSGLTAKGGPVPAGKDEVEVTVTAGADAKSGDIEVTAKGTGLREPAMATLRVTVK